MAQLPRNTNNAFLRIIASAQGVGIGGGGGTAYVPVITTATDSTGSPVPAGAHYVEFYFASNFVGTIQGIAYDGGTSSGKSFPVLENNTYGAITYTVTAGSMQITTF